MSAARFTIDVPRDQVDDLRTRLHSTRWRAPETGAGIDQEWLQDFCRYWADEYDWYAVQEQLNSEDQRLVRVGETDVHAQVWSSPDPDAVPLLLTHGWPSSFREMHRVAEVLSRPRAGERSFHVVAPSLPGFGFSPEPAEPMGVVEIALLWCGLMTELGFDRFAAHGGDFGAAVTAGLAALAPERLVGVHLTAATGVRPGRPLTAEEADWLVRLTQWRDRDGGYLAVQRTRPDTLAIALQDSPAGLAAWVLDRWWSWTDRADRQRLDDVVDRDELATLLSVYWFTGTIGSSMGLYLRFFGDAEPPGPFVEDDFRLEVPTHVARFREPIVPPRTLLEPHFDLRGYRQMPRGGHFPALEVPDDLADELRRAFA